MGVLDTRKLDSEVVVFISSELMVQMDYPGALAMFQRGRQALGDSLAYASEIGQVYQFQEDYFSALKEYARIIDQDASVYMRCSQLIGHVQEQGVPADSIAAQFVIYLAKHPESISAARLASSVYVQTGRYEDAFKVLRSPAIKTGNFADVWSLAEKIRTEGLSELAVSVYDDYYRSFSDVPSRSQALMAAGELLVKMGSHDEAKRRYQTIISDYAREKPGCYRIAEADRPFRGETSFETFTRMLNDFAGTTQYQESAFAAYVMLGEAYLRKGMSAESNTAYGSAKLKARSNAERYEIGIRLAYQAFYTGQSSQMDDQITQVIAISPGGADVNDLLALKIMYMRCAGKGDSVQFADYAKARYAEYSGESDEAIRLFTALGSDTTSIFSPEAAIELRRAVPFPEHEPGCLELVSPGGDGLFRFHHESRRHDGCGGNCRYDRRGPGGGEETVSGCPDELFRNGV